ncbi:MFS transporter [Streptomyces sp. AP-93]|uniref:MFS transporter n=1 Tax=Streptomyces sp. AP-93 TaxID=2929048 RepID=UPI001FB00088|nr:MFS transporter [Streptomyces sp. AP-93]MCJ0872060.1 MFS transporter [Streptomyces sp. AP-93]
MTTAQTQAQTDQTDQTDQTVRTDAPTGRPPLWDRRFTLYFTARAVSLVGDAMMPVAAALAVGPLYGISGVGFVLGTWTGTFVLLVLFGGVFADRVGARRMMVGADLVRVLTQGVLAAAFFAGTPPFWLLVTMAALAGAAVAMFQPGVNGMVPLVAREPQRANATLKVADALAQLLGPALAGLLIVLTGAGTVYAIDAGTFVLSALCLALIRLAPASTSAGTLADADGDADADATAVKRSSLRRDLRQGWQEFRSRTWMWAVILIWVAFGVLLFGPLVPLSSALIGARLGPNAYGVAVSFLGVGTVLGGLLALRLRPARPLAAGAMAMVLFTGLPLCVALGAGLPVLLAGHVLGGAAWAFWSVMWATSVQTHTPPAVLNRVTAYELAGSVSGIALGQILAGPATELASPETLLLVSGVTCLAGCVALLSIPAIRTLRRIAPTAGDELTAPVGPDGG